ncbi:MAG: dipeptidase [candidate division KSB1 bacterium]|nr:dipeptidase [candidate division KSB1 bacterium]
MLTNLFLICTTALLGLPLLATSQSKKGPLWQKALEIHRRAIVVDTHSDLTSRLVDENVDISKRLPDGHQDLPRMQEGGLDVQFFSVYVAAKYAQKGGPKRAMEMMDAVYRMVEKFPDRMEMASSVSDIYRIVGRGKIAALMGLEGGHALENSPHILRMFYRMGIRYITLTHSNTNDWCDSSTDKPRWGGLNELGEKIIAEMNRLGVMVDVSHISDEAFWDVIRVSKAPVIASHSSCRAIADMQRNMSDDMIKAMAEKGGVIMINFGSSFLNPEWGKRTNYILQQIRDKYRGDFGMWGKMWDEMNKKDPLPPATLKDLIDHIDHVVQLVGPDHVGLGSDFDGVSNLPVGMEDVSKLPAITYELLKRGYKEEDIRKILGGNLLRVMSEVERIAAELGQ